MPVTITPNMGLIEPVVGQEPGPNWASDLNASLGILDQHNHTSGQGVQITPAAININVDLPMNGNNLTLTNTVRFNNLLSTLAGSAPNLGCIYEAVNELYYNDGVGNVVQLTKAGTINATSSGISSGTASASFSGGVLIVDSNVNTPANIQAGSILFGNLVPGSNFATVSPPNSLGANYNITLPPTNSSGSTVLLSYDTSNNMGLGPIIVANQLTTAGIQDQAITQSKIAPKTAPTTVAGIGGIAMSSVASFSTSSPTLVAAFPDITITTTGGPVQLFLQGSSSGINSFLSVNNGTATDIRGYASFINVTTFSNISTMIIGGQLPINVNNQFLTPASACLSIDTSVIGFPGTYTYRFSMGTIAASSVAGITNSSFYAYEI